MWSLSLRAFTTLGVRPPVLFCCLNPSTADALVDDPTIRRCIGFAKGWGFNAMEMVNVFALRSTDPKVLKQDLDPVGPDNRIHIEAAAGRARDGGRIVAAWGGSLGTLRWRWFSEVVTILSRHSELWCLGKTQAGAPKHPLYLASDTSLCLY